MKNILRRFSGSMSESFGIVQGNSRAVLLMQPFWAIVSNLINPYLTLYMLGVGVTSAQVGQISAVGMVAGTVIAVFAGWITDRMGRRLANAFGDLICWVLACLIWGLSQNVVWFIAAACANSFMRISGVAWNCSLNEGTPPEHRMTIYWWLNVVATLAAFVTPLMSLLINPLGLVAAMRWVLLCSSGVLVVSTVIRYRMMRELLVGRERKEAARKESPLAAVQAYIPMLKLIFSQPTLIIFILLRTLYYVQVGVKGAFLPIAVVKGLGFANGTIGTLNFVTGGVMLLAQLLLLPMLRTLSTEKTLTFSMLTQIASMLMLVFSPVNSFFLLILSTVLSAGATVITAILVDTSLANALPDLERAQLLSMVTVLTVAISAPFMWLGGVLSSVSGIGPRLPLALITVLFAVCLALLWISGRMKKTHSKVKQELIHADCE
jgi:MFS family permease